MAGSHRRSGRSVAVAALVLIGSMVSLPPAHADDTSSTAMETPSSTDGVGEVTDTTPPSEPPAEEPAAAPAQLAPPTVDDPASGDAGVDAPAAAEGIPAALAAPSNDNFANAIALTGTPAAVTGSTVDATLQVGEPDFYGSGATVWWKWTVPATGRYRLEVTSAATTACLFRGTTVSSLTEVGCTELDLFDEALPVDFGATAGEVIRVQVSPISWMPEGGPASFGLQQIIPPPNDAFASAVALTGSPTTASGTTLGATTQTGEPASHGTSSAWWTWVVPATGAYQLSNTAESPFFACLYTGAAVNTLTQNACSRTFSFLDGADVAGSIDFWATAGTTLRIRVSEWDVAGPVDFSIQAIAAPANDLFANAEPLSGTYTSASGTTSGATKQSGEPAGDSTITSVWYSWTAPGSGVTTFDTVDDLVFWADQPYDPGYIDVQLCVYTGTTLGTLVKVGCGTGFEDLVKLSATTGKRYWVRVDGVKSAIGPFALRIRQPRCAGLVPTVDLTLGQRPTAGNDIILGTPEGDVIDGANGDDLICGGGTVFFSESLYGGGGNDRLIATPSDESMDGGAGVDTVNFSNGGAVTVDLRSVDLQDTGQGFDSFRNIENVVGSAFDDSITGNSLMNLLQGMAGNDILNGMANNDRIDGGIGTDTCDGGTGTDTHVAGCETRTGFP